MSDVELDIAGRRTYPQHSGRGLGGVCLLGRLEGIERETEAREKRQQRDGERRPGGGTFLNAFLPACALCTFALGAQGLNTTNVARLNLRQSVRLLVRPKNILYGC